MIILGIDPGVKTGVAWVETAGGGTIFPRLIRLESLDFWRCYELVCGQVDPETSILVIENAALNFGIYARRQGRAAVSDRVRERMAGNVGGVQRESELLIAGFRKQGFQVEPIRPAQRKWTEREFLALTGWQGKSNEHTRDAARLAWEWAAGLHLKRRSHV